MVILVLAANVTAMATLKNAKPQAMNIAV